MQWELWAASEEVRGRPWDCEDRCNRRRAACEREAQAVGAHFKPAQYSPVLQPSVSLEGTGQKGRERHLPLSLDCLGEQCRAAFQSGKGPIIKRWINRWNFCPRWHAPLAARGLTLRIRPQTIQWELPWVYGTFCINSKGKILGNS